MFFYEILVESLKNFSNNGYVQGLPAGQEQWRKFRLMMDEKQQLPKENDFNNGVYLWRDESYSTYPDGSPSVPTTYLFKDGKPIESSTSGGADTVIINGESFLKNPSNSINIPFIGKDGVKLEADSAVGITISGDYKDGENVKIVGENINAYNIELAQGAGIKLTPIYVNDYTTRWKIDSDLAGMDDGIATTANSSGANAWIDVNLDTANLTTQVNANNEIFVPESTPTQLGVIKRDDVTVKKYPAGHAKAGQTYIPTMTENDLGVAKYDNDTITLNDQDQLVATQIIPGKALKYKGTTGTAKYTVDVQYDNTTIKEFDPTGAKQLYLNKDDKSIIYAQDDGGASKVLVNFDGRDKTENDDVTILYGEDYMGNTDLYVRQAEARTVDDEGEEITPGHRGVVIPDGDTITMDADTGVITGTKTLAGNALRYREEAKERHMIDVITDDETIKVKDPFVYGDVTNESLIYVNKDDQTLVYDDDFDGEEKLIVNIDGKKSSSTVYKTLKYDEDNLVHVNTDEIVNPVEELSPIKDFYVPTIKYDEDKGLYVPYAKNLTWNSLREKYKTEWTDVQQFAQAGIVAPDNKTLEMDADKPWIIKQANLTQYDEATKTFVWGDNWHTPSAQAVISYINQLDKFEIISCEMYDGTDTPQGVKWQYWDDATSSVKTVTGVLSAELANHAAIYLVPKHIKGKDGESEIYEQWICTYIKEYNIWDWSSIGTTEIKLDKYVENINTVAGIPFYNELFDADEKDKNITATEIGSELYSFQEGVYIEMEAAPATKKNSAGEDVYSVGSDLYNFVRIKQDRKNLNQGVAIGDIDGSSPTHKYSATIGEALSTSLSGQVVVGKYNDNGAYSRFVVGNGVLGSNSNAFTADIDGNIYSSGNLYVQSTDWSDKTNNYKGKLIAPIIDDRIVDPASGNITYQTTKVKASDDEKEIMVGALLPVMNEVDDECLSFKFTF